MPSLHRTHQLSYTHCLLFNKTNPHGEKLRCNSQTLSCEWIHWAWPEGVKKLVLTPTDRTNHVRPIKMFQAHWKSHWVCVPSSNGFPKGYASINPDQISRPKKLSTLVHGSFSGWFRTQQGVSANFKTKYFLFFLILKISDHHSTSPMSAKSQWPGTKRRHQDAIINAEHDASTTVPMLLCSFGHSMWPIYFCSSGLAWWPVSRLINISIISSNLGGVSFAITRPYSHWQSA